ncbi:hypothetical protein [Aliikangiella marina]|nr:hypothetical protein [Aliikangiella marina]
MGIKSDPEVDKAVEKFTVELLNILLAKDISLLDKRQITFVHLSENKM